MTQVELEKALADALGRIAPDIDVADIDRDGDLREEFDIDSMDFLNLVTALSKQFSLSVPEKDYQSLGSFSAIITYLAEKTA
ncbi:acyl carrier protein [Cohaesibacter celericrescens]|uniref:Phosphopantetheine-binding protein n=1 Tax=Cohaesibacter celericrescens TaxID=2067669 RepID=A0A2N5XVF4_9HYPH|nr:acyl carrier protein [Cohaesibacter celericrescens]PLW78474.1 phosphopantetheine-binding protein [Cohaesibacter celericrescens]